MTASEVITTLLCSGVIAILTFATVGYAFLHHWNNAFAEALRFGDRQFYRNFWSSCHDTRTAFSHWNLLIKNWIVDYLYLPIALSRLGRRTPEAAGIIVAAVVAVVHDYVISFAAGFFFPAFCLIYAVLLVPALLYAAITGARPSKERQRTPRVRVDSLRTAVSRSSSFQGGRGGKRVAPMWQTMWQTQLSLTIMTILFSGCIFGATLEYWSRVNCPDPVATTNGTATLTQVALQAVESFLAPRTFSCVSFNLTAKAVWKHW